jgi:hypothetical protein
VGDRQLEQGRPGGLDRVAGGHVRDRALVERPGRQHGALGVSRDRPAEQVVVNSSLDHDRGEQVHRERQRIGAEAEAIGADPAVGARRRHAPGERPAVVVDGRRLAAVVLVRAEQFFRVLAEHAAPQVEVVGLVPRRLA